MKERPQLMLERACKATRSQFWAHCLSHRERPKGTVTSQLPQDSPNSNPGLY